jgi:glucosamine--fructose-6-phosphate aminotransferase (isomerizing)
MCGIIGYTGGSPALSMVIDSLRKLEYRGYDSAGIALTSKAGEKLIVAKRAGKLSNLESALTSDHADSLSGIVHISQVMEKLLLFTLELLKIT